MASLSLDEIGEADRCGRLHIAYVLTMILEFFDADGITGDAELTELLPASDDAEIIAWLYELGYR